VFRRQYHVGGAKKRVGPGSKHLYFLLVPFNFKYSTAALAAPYPVALHGLNRLGPVQAVQIIQQPVRIRGNFEYPLPYAFSGYLCAAAFAASVLYFFVGQAGFAGRAPVDGRVGFVCKSLFEQLDEYPLCPFVIVFFAGGYFPVPIIGKAKVFYLCPEALNIFSCCDRRVGSGLDGVIFRRQAKESKPMG